MRSIDLRKMWQSLVAWEGDTLQDFWGPKVIFYDFNWPSRIYYLQPPLPEKYFTISTVIATLTKSLHNGECRIAVWVGVPGPFFAPLSNPSNYATKLLAGIVLCKHYQLLQKNGDARPVVPDASTCMRLSGDNNYCFHKNQNFGAKWIALVCLR